MKHYTKNGEIKSRDQIVLRVTREIDGKERQLQVYNPSHDMLIEQGWEEVIEPSEEEVAKQREASRLRRSLSTTDYKVIKCMEAYLCGEALPYDIEALHAERNAQRSEINRLEE